MKTSITHHQEEIHSLYLPQFTPARIIEIELDRSISSISARVEATGRLYERALCVVRLHGHLLGTVEFQFDDKGVSASACARHIWLALQQQINDHLQGDALPTITGLDGNGLSASDIPACVEERARFLAHAPFVTIIVPTHNRSALLQHCIDSLLQLRYPHYEIIVVDNAPTDTLTADLLHQRYGHLPHVRYLREERAGPSHARNCGLAAATGGVPLLVEPPVLVCAAPVAPERRVGVRRLGGGHLAGGPPGLCRSLARGGAANVPCVLPGACTGRRGTSSRPGKETDHDHA